MVAYGFRVHTLQPRLRRTQKFLRVEDVTEAAGQPDACAELYRAAQELEGQLKLGAPVFYQDEDHEAQRQADIDAADDVPYFVLESVTQTERVLKFVISTGRESDHDGLRSRTGDVETMKRRAAVRKLRVWIVFPTAGEYAFMISETRGRGYAGELLISWITRTLQHDAVSVNQKGKREESNWLHWKVEPRVDGHRLDSILKNSSDHTLKLRRRMVDSTGARGSFDLEFIQYGLKNTPVAKLGQAIEKMAGRKGSEARAAREAAAASDVIGLIADDVSDLDFNDGEISFKENGKVQTINAETVDRLFVYPLGSKKPKKGKLYEAGYSVIEKLAPTLGVQLN